MPSNLTYKVKAVGAVPEAALRGLWSDAGALGEYSVRGVGFLFNPRDLSDLGFIKTWLLLGPYTQPIGLTASPGLTNIRKDHLTDEGRNKELTFRPRAGDQILTHYGPPSCFPEGGTRCTAPPKARSTGLSAPATPNGINPGGIPTWAEWRDRDGTIDFNDYYGGNVDNVMMYAVAYLKIESDVNVDLGAGSDDSIQILLDDQEIHINNISRGSGGNNAIQDVVSHAVLRPLIAGCHILMVKVFEGEGDHQFRLRFQDAKGHPVTHGILIFLDPDCSCPDAPSCNARFHRGDADNDGQLQLSDAVRTLGYLFLAEEAPACLDAADADGNNRLEVTDAVRILGYLFLGQAPPVAPGPPPQACGPDNDATHLGCATYDKCVSPN